MALQTETLMNEIREFASEFYQPEQGHTLLPIQFNALHGKSCYMERLRSSVTLIWEDCKANKQVGCFSIGKPIPTNGAKVLTMGFHASEDVTLAAACCVDGVWTRPVRSMGGSDNTEVSIPIDGDNVDQVAFSLVAHREGPQKVTFPWFSLHSGPQLD